MDVSFFKNLIERRIEELTADQLSMSSGNTSIELDQTRVGRLSRMDAIQMQQMDQALARRRNKEISQLTAALDRLQDDEFGYCEQCGEEINEKRLEVDPSMTFCIQCAHAMESASR